MTDSTFDRATAVSAAGGAADRAVFAIEVDPDWTIGDKPNGGYLLATLARAAIATVGSIEGPDHPHPVAATAHYVASPPLGPAEAHLEVLRRGRRMSQTRARLIRDDGSPCVEATFALGRHDPATEPWWSDVAEPDLPPRDDCVRLPGVAPTGVALPIMQHVDVRLDPAVMGFASGQPSGAGELRGWLTFADGRPPDPLALLFAVDAFPPATFDLAMSGWVPTLELTVYVRGVPAPGPLLVRQRAGLVEAGLVDEVCHVWDSRGRLVAQATQLAGIRVGETPSPART
ncbi:MAG TPA: thioesterase family protein [Acidimicrobiales bacterium]|nr:thioesterase family protein [Acidimicrobiales bacterium]